MPKQLQKKSYYGKLNKEFNIFDPLSKKVYFYDFVISSLKFCVEFNGDKFHANPSIYDSSDSPNPFSDMSSSEIWKRDKIKNSALEKRGFEIYLVWENEYKKDKNKVIEQIYRRIYEKGKGYFKKEKRQSNSI